MSFAYIFSPIINCSPMDICFSTAIYSFKRFKSKECCWDKDTFSAIVFHDFFSRVNACVPSKPIQRSPLNILLIASIDIQTIILLFSNLVSWLLHYWESLHSERLLGLWLQIWRNRNKIIGKIIRTKTVPN